MRDPRYRHEAPTTARDHQVLEGNDPSQHLQLQLCAGSQAPASLSPVIWGCFDTDIQWGGQLLSERDELLTPPDWSIAEPSWHPRSAGRPTPPRVRLRSPELPGQSAWIKW